MAFCITFGTHTFIDQLQGYEGVTARCRNCGNWAAHCRTSWQWVTICFVPVIPTSVHKYKEVYCPICHTPEDIGDRSPQQLMMDGQGQYGPPQGQHGPPQGQYGPPQGPYGPPQGQYPPPQGQNGGQQGWGQPQEQQPMHYK